MIRRPFITTCAGGGYIHPGHTVSLITELHDRIRLCDRFDLPKTLDMLNIKYVLQRNDMAWSFYENPTLGIPPETRVYLESYEGLELLRESRDGASLPLKPEEWGPLDLYRRR